MNNLEVESTTMSVVTVADIMSTQLHAVTATQTLDEISAIFASVRFHHLPVVEDNKILGIISDRDVSSNLSPFVGTNRERDSDRELLQQTAADIMSDQIISVDRGTDLDTASILLLENNISCLPVVGDDEQLEGLITWKDLLEYFVYADS